jgi:hypothetical protein
MFVRVVRYEPRPASEFGALRPRICEPALPEPPSRVVSRSETRRRGSCDFSLVTDLRSLFGCRLVRTDRFERLHHDYRAGE